jgi:hypothetical protein
LDGGQKFGIACGALGAVGACVAFARGRKPEDEQQQDPFSDPAGGGAVPQSAGYGDSAGDMAGTKGNYQQL